MAKKVSLKAVRNEYIKLLNELLDGKNGLIIHSYNTDEAPCISNTQPNDSEQFTLEELQSIVDGYVEIVYIEGTEYIMIVNEDGKCRNMKPNRIASIIYGYDNIVGDVLICHTKQVA